MLPPSRRVETTKEEHKETTKVDAVLHLLRKQSPLTVKQEKFCTDACVERFLKWKGENVKKAAKHLRACLSWRETIGADHVMADEFSAELAEGVAYVAGHDDEARPVLVFRIKQDYPKLHSQKSLVRLVVFTLEVAISCMSRFVEQFVVLFDASFFRSASAFLNLFMGTLKLVSEYYPGRLHRAFVVDPPSLFPYLWKGARPFVEHWSSTSVVSSVDLEDPVELDSFAFSANPRTTSLRFEPPPVSLQRQQKPSAVGSVSSRFSFTVSQIDSLKPWYLSRTETTSPSISGAARSLSFASPSARSTPRQRGVPATPLPRTPRPGFLNSPALAALFGGRTPAPERAREAFAVYLRFYRKPYDEMVYRSRMRPPLGGIVSIVSPHVIRQQRCRHVSQQRF